MATLRRTVKRLLRGSKNKTRIAAAGLILLLVPTYAQSETYNLRVGSGLPGKGPPFMEAIDQFFLPEIAKRVKAKTGDEIVWTRSYAGTLAKLPEALEATRTKLFDVGVLIYSFMTADLFTHNFPFYFPFQSGDPELAVAATRKTYDEIDWLPNLFSERYNQKFLALAANGDYGFGGTFPFKTFADLDGKKIGAAGPNLEWFRGTGAVPVNSNLNEAYTSLKTHVYDGFVIFPGPYFGFKLQEVGKYYEIVGLGSPSAISLNINTDTWNSLPSAIQEVFLEVGREHDKFGATYAKNADSKALAALRSAGAEVSEFPVAERAKWAKALADYPNEKAQEANSRGAPGTKIFQTYMTNMENLGYTWPYRYVIK